jgi:ankyrin repeat protein
MTFPIAVQLGDTEEVRRFLSEGANVNATTGELGRTPLMEAASRGHLEVVGQSRFAAASRYGPLWTSLNRA